MPSSEPCLFENSEAEVELMLLDDSRDLEICYSAASQLPTLAASKSSKLPKRLPIPDTFTNSSTSHGSQAGTSSSHVAPHTRCDAFPSTPTGVSTPLLSTSHQSTSVSVAASSTDRRIRTVGPAVLSELEQKAENLVGFDDFVNALQTLTKLTGANESAGHMATLENDEKRLKDILDNPPTDITNKHNKFVSSLGTSEKPQYVPFSELCNTITSVVSPEAFGCSSGMSVPKLFTTKNDPTPLICSRDDVLRTPDVITVPENTDCENLLMANVHMLWEFKLKVSAMEAGLAESSEQLSPKTTTRRSSSKRSQDRVKVSVSSPTTPQSSTSPQSRSALLRIGVQLGTYVTEIFSSGPLRSHVICGAVQGGFMTLWWFDRAGVIRSKPVDLGAPDGLKHLMKLFYQLTRLGRRGWGFVWRPGFVMTPKDRMRNQVNTSSSPRAAALNPKASLIDSTGPPDDSQVIDLSTLRDEEDPGEDQRVHPIYERERVKRRRTNPLFGRTVMVDNTAVDITNTVYRQYGLFSRGVVVANGTMWMMGKEIEVVIKFSWQLSKLAQEFNLAQKARHMADQEMQLRLPQLYVKEEWDSTDSTFRGHWGMNPKTGHRRLVVLVAERLDRFATIDNPEDLKRVVSDVAHCHRWLVRQAGILHRDISFENIMVRRCNDRVHGVLNDFDLALDLLTLDGDSTQGRAQITGTRLFMATELLESDAHRKTVHSGRHDMESLFWVVIWFICRYEGGKEREPGPEGSKLLDDWLSDPDLKAKKSNFLHTSGREVAMGLPQVWRDAWLDWIGPLCKYYRDFERGRNDLLAEVNDAAMLSEDERKLSKNKIDTSNLWADTIAWADFLEILHKSGKD